MPDHCRKKGSSADGPPSLQPPCSASPSSLPTVLHSMRSVAFHSSKATQNMFRGATGHHFGPHGHKVISAALTGLFKFAGTISYLAKMGKGTRGMILQARCMQCNIQSSHQWCQRFACTCAHTVALHQFMIWRQTRYPPYAYWAHVGVSVWADVDAFGEESADYGGFLCHLFTHCPDDISRCGTCHLFIHV